MIPPCEACRNMSGVAIIWDTYIIQGNQEQISQNLNIFQYKNQYKKLNVKVNENK